MRSFPRWREIAKALGERGRAFSGKSFLVGRAKDLTEAGVDAIISGRGKFYRTYGPLAQLVRASGS